MTGKRWKESLPEGPAALIAPWLDKHANLPRWGVCWVRWSSHMVSKGAVLGLGCLVTSHACHSEVRVAHAPVLVNGACCALQSLEHIQHHLRIRLLHNFQSKAQKENTE